MRTLLLADDSVTTQRVIALTFADESFRVVTVSDGQQALDAMAAARPEIVLAGTLLPRISGYDLAQQMQGIPALRDVPVLLLSGAFESVDAARLKASGARGVIEKPLEPTAVITRVRELLGFKDTRPAAPAGRLVTSATGPADRKAPARPSSTTTTAARSPVVSTWDELRKETGLEPDARSVEGASGTGREGYLDTLDAAFDSLDQHLAGRHQDTPVPHRNPSPPLGQASGAGLDFGLDDLAPKPAFDGPDLVLPIAAPAPIPVAPAPAPVAPMAPMAPVAPVPWVAPSSVADDFAALLAFETGDAPEPPPTVAPTATAAPTVVQAVAPEITEVMLDQIAQRVADRLNSSNFGADLRAAMATVIRETVRSVVSDTSERLVREEIGRVKAKAERDTQ